MTTSILPKTQPTSQSPTIRIRIRTAKGLKPVQLIGAAPSAVTVRDENGPLSILWQNIHWMDWPTCQKNITINSPREL